MTNNNILNDIEKMSDLDLISLLSSMEQPDEKTDLKSKAKDIKELRGFVNDVKNLLEPKKRGGKRSNKKKTEE